MWILAGCGGPLQSRVFWDPFETLACAVGFYSYRFELKNLTFMTKLQVSILMWHLDVQVFRPSCRDSCLGVCGAVADCPS